VAVPRLCFTDILTASEADPREERTDGGDDERGLRWVSNGPKGKAQDAVRSISGIAEPPTPCLTCQGETPMVSGMGWDLAAAMERGPVGRLTLCSVYPYNMPRHTESDVFSIASESRLTAVSISSNTNTKLEWPAPSRRFMTKHKSDPPGPAQRFQMHC
jgi:hypothetical protein